MSIKRITYAGLLLPAMALLLVASFACGGDDNGGDNGGSNPPEATPTQASGNGNDNGNSDDNGNDAEEVTITMGDNFFEPADITIPVDTTVAITVVNDGVAIHNMHVLSADAEGEDFTSDAMVNPGDSSTFEVHFGTTGVFDFQCDYHLPEMVGTITVE